MRKRLFQAFSYPSTVWFPKTEHNFLIFICGAFLLSMFVTPYPNIAMWVGFLFAAYAAIANDSIQTIGTFIASNQDKSMTKKVDTASPVITKKIGRNEPCPCGSGKKYKHCHGS